MILQLAALEAAITYYEHDKTAEWQQLPAAEQERLVRRQEAALRRAFLYLAGSPPA